VSDTRWHLAQLNVGRLLAPVESPAGEGFRAQLEPVNALADTHPGFVWRLQTETGNATDIRPTDDDLFLINMSVWESIEALRAFTYTTAHVHVLKERRSWFEQHASAHLVLWWVPAGHIPTIEEAMDRLERLRRDGPTAAAFTFRTPFTPEADRPGGSLVDAEFCWPEVAAR
jgi:heme-degrading monooxygenase HmoA